MRPSPSILQRHFSVPDSTAPKAPQWVDDLIGTPSEAFGGGIQVQQSDRFALISLALADAASFDGIGLEQAAADAYREIARELFREPPWHLVRLWNFIPDILGEGGNGMDRYMRFNAGRHRAFSEWFGGTADFDRLLPTASGVGHGGGDLVIHALACREPGTPVSNPRQLAPHRYSTRFGPVPPCFARATLLPWHDGRRMLLVGGTASVRGEESVHVGDLLGQLNETFENLAALVRNALGEHGLANPLNHFRDLRIYHVRGHDLARIRSAVARSFPSRVRAEYLTAHLCRPDLLVEIEGFAQENS